jgi:tetratricopeptide (TPR) repeat protein
MNPTPSFTPSAGKSLPRDQFLILLRTSLAVNTASFSHRAALMWLAHYPGDLQVRLLYAQSLIAAGSETHAIPVLEEICRVDPQYQEAQSLLADLQVRLEDKTAPTHCANLYVLGGYPESEVFLPDWAYRLREAFTSLDHGAIALAEDLVHQVLAEDCPSPLAAILHLEISLENNIPPLALRDLALHYQKGWPDCLYFTLRLADALMQTGDSDRAVELLHKAAANDVEGQVAARLWGCDHPFKTLWPTRLAAPIDLAVPSPLAAALGWNQLPDRGETVQAEIIPIEIERVNPEPDPQPIPHRIEPEPGMPEDTPASTAVSRVERRQAPPNYQQAIPETLRDVQDELERVAGQLNQDHIARSDGRFPVYVVFTSRYGLEKNYGSKASEVEAELKRLVSAVGQRPGWRSVLVFGDDPQSLSPWSIRPAKPDDPWDLKLVLVDLDAELAKQGEMIGAVLIVGGPEIVPFHHLPNPVDDADVDAPSDNPYATRDENYFIPEWPVGRLPGGSQSDPEPLLDSLRSITRFHLQAPTSRSWFRRSLAWLVQKTWFWSRKMHPSWGYTAAVWRRAAVSVFRPIGAPHAMLVSPPMQVNGRPGRFHTNQQLPSAQLGYFNLHGVQDSNDWYGQRDPSEPGTTPDYPVALRPQDILNGSGAPKIVFSEACFGAHIINKEVGEALALKFLAGGSQAVVGSTCTAYGSITPPLIAADLLGHTFWRYLREGVPAGEALRRAKIHVAREMLRRQGYLDGEDQKTLITFVYYGDPLAQPVGFGAQPKTIYRSLKRPKSIKTVCDRAVRADKSPTLENIPPIPVETLSEVKRVVEQYLPGMRDAQVLFTHEQAECHAANHTCPTSQLTTRSRLSRQPERSVVTLSKQIQSPPGETEDHMPDGVEASQDEAQPSRIHWHYARLTLDQEGHIVKMAVSR